MEFNEIYRLETLGIHETEVANLLLANGWEVQSIQQRGDLTIDGLPEVMVSTLLGATKEVYENYPIEKAIKELEPTNELPW